MTAGSGDEDLDYRYCTECVVTGERVDRRHLREQLSTLGGSLVVAGLQHKARVHIHVNDPAEVFRVAARVRRSVGEKADDMQRQQHSAHSQDRRVAIVTDSAADIPDDELDRLDIHMVPVRVHFGERSYLDKVGITLRGVLRRDRAGRHAPEDLAAAARAISAASSSSSARITAPWSRST